MKNIKIISENKVKMPNFKDSLWEESWTYIRTVVDIAKEPILILDNNFNVMAANLPFYQMFKVTPKDTINKCIYELGNGQWNMPGLKKLFENILLKDTFFKGFEVIREFPDIGRRVFMLNARQIFFKKNAVSELFPPIVLLAMEDVSEMMAVAETVAGHANQVQVRLTERAKKFEIYAKKLEKEISILKREHKSL